LLTRHLTGGTTAKKLAKRSGNLRAQTQPFPSKNEGKVRAKGGIEFGAEYSGVHISAYPKSTIIKPRRGKYLAIPVQGSPAMSGSGVKNYYGSIRANYPFLNFVHAKSGNALLVDRRGGRFIPYFILKKQVVVPSRVHLNEILDREARIVEVIYRKAIKLLVQTFD
jgi:hypothetical protein